MKSNGNRRLPGRWLAGALVALCAAGGQAGAQNWILPEAPVAGPVVEPQPAPDAQGLATRLDRLEEVVRRLLSDVELLRRQRGGATVDAAPPAPIPEPAPALAAQPGHGALAEGPPTPLLPLPQPRAARPVLPQPVTATPPLATSTVERALLPALPEAPAGPALRGPQQGAVPGAVALLPDPRDDGAEAAYAAAYRHLLAEDMEGAGTGFAAFLERYPAHELAGNAQYWLAEAHFARGDFARAAREYRTGYTRYAASPKAPDSLLKLALALAALGRGEEACASFRELARRFPDADPAVQARAAADAANAGC